MIVDKVNNAISLGPGDLYISTDLKVVKMILGTCVSVILYDAEKKIGAVCHAQLAEKRYDESACSDSCPNPCYKGAPDENQFKYLTCSIRYMLQSLNGMGIGNNRLIAYLVGGASVFKGSKMGNAIAQDNIRVAKKMLQQVKIPILRQDTGGSIGRKLAFEMETGNIMVSLIRESN